MTPAMTIQDLKQDTHLNDDRASLAARGIVPNDTGSYTVAQIEQAIRERGWQYRCLASRMIGSPVWKTTGRIPH